MFRHRIPDRIADLIRDIERLDEDAECEEDWREIRAIEREVERFFLWWREHHHHHPPPPPPPAEPATTLTLTIKGATMAVSFNVDDTLEEAQLQFTGATNNPVAGPSDSVTGAPVVPVVTSDNTAVATVAAAVAGATPGSWTAAITGVTAGTANVGVAPLTNSDGTPVNEEAGPETGQPFSVPAAVAVTVTDLPEGLSISVADGPAPAPPAPPAPPA